MLGGEKCVVRDSFSGFVPPAVPPAVLCRRRVRKLDGDNVVRLLVEDGSAIFRRGRRPRAIVVPFVLIFAVAGGGYTVQRVGLVSPSTLAAEGRGDAGGSPSLVTVLSVPLTFRGLTGRAGTVASPSSPPSATGRAGFGSCPPASLWVIALGGPWPSPAPAPGALTCRGWRGSSGPTKGRLPRPSTRAQPWLVFRAW
jgi:hypothetical protein